MGCNFFFFFKFLILQAGEPKYWGPRKIFSILGSQKFSESCQIWLVGDIDKKKTASQISWSITKKISSPIGLKVSEKKGENLFLCSKNLVSRKMQNKKNCRKIFFFSFVREYFCWFCSTIGSLAWGIRIWCQI